MTLIFTSTEAALFIRLILHFDPHHLSTARLSRAQRRLLSCGRMKPTPAVLRKLKLTPTEGGYQWHIS